MARERVRGGGEGGDGTEEQASPGRLDDLDRALEAYVSENGPGLGRGEALLQLARASGDAEKLDERQLQDRYDVGERLVEFAARRGHVALGYTNIGMCFRQRFKLGRSWAFDSMRLAKAATRADLQGLNWTVASLGLQLADLLGVESLGALKKKALPVPSFDGDAVYFPAAPDVLEAAIAELERRKAPEAAAPTKPKPPERQALEAADRILQDHLERYPALAEARPTVFIRDGTAQIRTASVELRSETFAALAKLYTALEKAVRQG